MTIPPLAPTARLVHRRTPRGKPMICWKDASGCPCSMSASVRGRDCLWIGVDGQHRMYLDRATVAALLPLLTTFVERGTIREEGDRR